MIETNIQIKESGPDIELTVVKVIESVAEVVPIAFRQLVNESIPAGRIYRRGVITRKATRKLEREGYKRKGATRIIVGTKFHRASKKGQIPARDTGKLYYDIKVFKRGKFSRQVRFNAPYSTKVEETRPFVDRTIERAQELGVQRMI